jgi:hypothetical protein
MATDMLVFYKSGFLRKQWRWRYVAFGNHEKLGNGGEGYERLNDAMKAAFRVCGMDNPWTTGEGLFTENSQDVVVERDNGFDVEIRVR